jgi:DNA-binding response OmpR family regulator
LQNVLCAGDLRFDQATRELWRGATLVPLTARETAFIEFFIRNAGIVLTQPMIETALWESDRDTVSNLIRVYVGRLRAKLSPNGEPDVIHTVRGIGYRLGSG